MEVSAKTNLEDCVRLAFLELFQEIYMSLEGSLKE